MAVRIVMGWSLFAVMAGVVWLNVRRIRRLERELDQCRAQVDQLAEVAPILQETRRPPRPPGRRHLKLLGIPAAVLAADHLAAKTAVAAAVAVGVLGAGTVTDREGSRPLERTPPAAAEERRPHAGLRAPDTTPTAAVWAGTVASPPSDGALLHGSGQSPRGEPAPTPTTTVPATTSTSVPPTTSTTLPPVEINTTLPGNKRCLLNAKVPRLLRLDVCLGTSTP